MDAAQPSPLRRRRPLVARLRYLRALAWRFRVTIVLGLLLTFGAPALFHLLYRLPDGRRISFLEAVHHTYFLLYGQPSLPYVDSLLIEALNLVIPPFGIAVVVDGFVRFAYLFFAKRRSDREWIEVISQTYEGHVIVCGAGRIGFRVATQLVVLGEEVVVVEKREDAAFVGALRDLGLPVLIDDIKSQKTLERVNLRKASAIVCATDDDLANLNVALDARKEHPSIRVVIRLFDDDLVAKVRDTFKAEALSSSALAAPAMALAALDPRIVHSFQLGPVLMVVSPFTVTPTLAGSTLGQLHERFHALALSRARDARSDSLPDEATVLVVGDVVVVQASYDDYRSLRAHTGESRPPVCVIR